MIESEAARLLAVRRVTEDNEGKDTAGVDGIKSLTPTERLAMASTIHPRHWNQQPSRPVRRVWISKPGTIERRPLGILPMIDRCKQALVKLALEPEWEAKFEPHIIHTLTPFQGQAGFDFLSFTLRQYPVEKPRGFKTIIRWLGWNIMRLFASQKQSLEFKTVITPSEEASKRHLAVIGQRMRQLQSAPQAQVIRELNPLIGGWAAYYSGLVSAEAMSRYDDQVEHLLMNWAHKRHPNKARDWLLNRYWHRAGKRGRIFATPEGAELRTYRQTSRQR